MSLTATTPGGGEFAAALRDIREGFRLSPVWGYLALRDIRARYRRTLLGPFWIAGGTVFTSIGLALVFGGLFGQPLEVAVPYIASGIIAFTFIAALSFDANAVMINAAPTIKALPLPHTFHLWRFAANAILVFLHNLVAFILLVLVITRAVPLSLVLIPALMLVAAASLAWGFVISMVSARFRDVQYMLIYVSLLAFFLTPIFWRLSDLPPARQSLMRMNPFLYMVELARKPMLGELPTAADWGVTAGVLATGLIVGFLTFMKSRRRLVFWV